MSRLLLCSMLVIGFAACTPAPQAASSDLPSSAPTSLILPTAPAPTASVPLEVSTQNATPTSIAQAPTPEVTLTDGITPVSWKQLIDPQVVTDVEWTPYNGQLMGDEKGSLRNFRLSYPSQWAVTTNPTPDHFSVQNIAETAGGGPAAGDFVKLEIVPVKGPLSETGEGKEQLIQLDGQTAVLRTNVTQPGQALQTSIAIVSGGTTYMLSGYVNLSKADQAALDRYHAILLSMMSTFQLT